MMDMTFIQTRIIKECDSIKNMLLAKNKSYGNAAAEPIHIFSKTSALKQIHIRIDDKLKRIKNGTEHSNDDTNFDLIGYLILERIVASYEKEEEEIV